MSIVIPAYNCAEGLPRLLAPLFQQTYPQDEYEIIVVDDGSTDATAAVGERLLAAWRGAGRVIRKANGGPASARNAGFRASQADVIAFLDADCEAPPDWLDAMVSALRDDAADGVGGPILDVTSPGWVPGYMEACQFHRQRLRDGKVDYLLTPSVAFRRDALVAVGGFREEPGVWAEDADLSFRLKRAGYSLTLASGGTVTHLDSVSTVRALMRQLYRYGFGLAALSRDWNTGRTPLKEFVRHAGAVALSLPLALRLTKRVGLARAVSYWPLIAIEHASFCWGIVSAVGSGAVRHSER